MQKHTGITLETDDKLTDVMNELINLELFLHHPGFKIKQKDLEMIIDDNFWEVGASGKVHSRAHALETVVQRSENPNAMWQTENFYCVEISKNNYLLTYMITTGEVVSRRSSIWRRTGNDYKILFHQGTIVQDIQN